LIIFSEMIDIPIREMREEDQILEGTYRRHNPRFNGLIYFLLSLLLLLRLGEYGTIGVLYMEYKEPVSHVAEVVSQVVDRVPAAFDLLDKAALLSDQFQKELTTAQLLSVQAQISIDRLNNDLTALEKIINSTIGWIPSRGSTI